MNTCPFTAETLREEKLRSATVAAMTARDVAQEVYEKAMTLAYAEFGEGAWTVKLGWMGKSRGDA